MELVPNCSEIVTRITESNLENFKDTAKKIINSSKLSIYLKNATYLSDKKGYYELNIKLNADDCNLISKKGKDKYQVDINKLIKPSDMPLLKILPFDIKTMEQSFQIVANNNICKSKPEFEYAKYKDWSDSWGDGGSVSLQENCGFDSGMVSALTGDYDVKTYPILFELEKLFNVEVEGHDGGETQHYEDWREYWKKNKKPSNDDEEDPRFETIEPL